MRTPENGWSIQEAGMAQLDDVVGSVMTYLKNNGLDDDTIVIFNTDNGAENFTWPDGGQTPFAGEYQSLFGEAPSSTPHRPAAQRPHLSAEIGQPTELANCHNPSGRTGYPAIA
jgi:hypothetical protein